MAPEVIVRRVPAIILGSLMSRGTPAPFAR